MEARTVRTLKNGENGYFSQKNGEHIENEDFSQKEWREWRKE